MFNVTDSLNWQEQGWKYWQEKCFLFHLRQEVHTLVKMESGLLSRTISKKNVIKANFLIFLGGLLLRILYGKEVPSLRIQSGSSTWPLIFPCNLDLQGFFCHSPSVTLQNFNLSSPAQVLPTAWAPLPQQNSSPTTWSKLSLHQCHLTPISSVSVPLNPNFIALFHIWKECLEYFHIHLSVEVFCCAI